MYFFIPIGTYLPICTLLYETELSCVPYAVGYLWVRSIYWYMSEDCIYVAVDFSTRIGWHCLPPFGQRAKSNSEVFSVVSGRVAMKHNNNKSTYRISDTNVYKIFGVLNIWSLGIQAPIEQWLSAPQFRKLNTTRSRNDMILLKIQKKNGLRFFWDARGDRMLESWVYF